MTPVARTILSLIALTLTTTTSWASWLDMDELGASLNGWRNKGGTAAEYKSADSNYRTYRPTVSPQEGGIYVSTKIDHIRGFGSDDHAFVELYYDEQGTLTDARTQMTIGGAKWDTKWIAAGVAVYNPGMGAAAFAANEIFQDLRTFVSRLNEHGGRANFPAVVRHNINLISNAVHP